MLNRTTKIAGGVVGLGMVITLLLYFHESFSLKKTFNEENLRLKEGQVKLKNLERYNREELERENSRVNSCFLPQSKGSEIIERFTMLGKEKQLVSLDISSKFADLSEEEQEDSQIMSTLKVFSIEMSWSCGFKEVADYLEALIAIADFPFIIREVEIKKDVARGKLRLYVLLETYLLS